MFNIIVKKNEQETDYSYANNIDFNNLNQGLGPIFVLYIVFNLLESRKISIDDIVEINDIALKEKGKGVVGYQRTDKINLLQVLSNFKVTAGVDSLFLLANHVYIKTQKKMSEYFNDLISQRNQRISSSKIAFTPVSKFANGRGFSFAFPVKIGATSSPGKM